MAKTTRALIEDAKRLLLGGQSQQMNKLAANVVAGATQLTFQYPLSGIEAGARIAIGFELFHVWAVDQTAKMATVDGAQEGSTAAGHTAGDIAYIKPKFSDFAILQALNDDIADLSSPGNGLFRIQAVDITWDATIAGYTLTAPNMLGEPLELRYKTSSIDKYWPVIDPGDYDVARDMAASEFASGSAIFIRRGGQQGYPIRLRYMASFGSLSTDPAEDVETVTGLPATALDIPPLGAAARLVLPREVKRNFTEAQGDSRRGDEVPAGAVANSGKALIQLRQQRIMAEAYRLQAEFPIDARNL